MPLLSTKGGASATGFGMFGESVVFNITTVTYTSNATWTVPAGVSNVLTLVGRGSGGESDRWEYKFFFSYINAFADISFPPSTSPTADWSGLYAVAQNNLATLNAGAPGIRTATGLSYSYNIAQGNGLYRISNEPSSGGPYTIRNSAVLYQKGISQTSGLITFNSLYPPAGGTNESGWRIDCEYLITGRAGSASTGFGYTFPGGGYTSSTPGSGVGYPATPITYNNIAVTPGQTFSLVIPSGGSIAISYLAPA